MSAPVRSLPVYVGAREPFAAKARWVLGTLLAALGARLETVADTDRAGACLLAYARTPIPGVPTLPASERAVDVIAAGHRLPRNSFVVFSTGAGQLPGAFAVEMGDDVEGGGSFAAPFDVVASAFVLLACWDEHTSTARDRYDRLPYEASIFATNPVLDVGRPVVDEYVRFLRSLVDGRLEELGQEPLAAPDWGPRGQGEAGPARFALALTHDVDNLKRWTVRGWAAAGKRATLALAGRDAQRARFELGSLRWALTRDVPRGGDPYWTFPDMLRREDEHGVSSTFFIIASHGHPTDGVQPAVYHRRLPRLLSLLRAAGREVGLHGNHRDRFDPAALAADREKLSERAATAVDGMRYHYLRCLYHETLPLLEEAGFAYDSSLAFAEREGFRCGCAFPFHPYDLARDQPLSLVELPLVLMDTTLQGRQYRGMDAEGARAASEAILARVRDAGGGAAILWHNNRFHPYIGRGYGDVFWDLLDRVRADGGVALPAGELVDRWRRRAGETTS